MPRRHVAADKGWAGRDGQRRLCNIVARISLDQAGEFLLLFFGRVRPDQHAVAARFIGRLDDQFMQMRQHVLAVFRVAALPGRHIGDARLFIEVVLDNFRHPGVHHLVIGHACARRIGQCDFARAPGAHQARHAEQRVFAEHFGVEKGIVNAPINHIDPLQPGNRAHEDLIVVVDHQIAPFDQLHAHHLGQIGMLEIG